MDRSTVLDYPNLTAEQLEHWARVAFRQWAMRPGPAFTYLKAACWVVLRYGAQHFRLGWRRWDGREAEAWPPTRAAAM